MAKLLYLTGELNYQASSRQMAWAAAALAGRGHQVHVVILHGMSALARELVERGVSVDHLSWSRAFDPSPLLSLRRIFKASDADLIHLWGPGALRAFLATGRQLARAAACALLPPGGKPNLWNRWLLKQVGTVLALGPLEERLYRDAGVDRERIRLASPGVPVPPRPDSGGDDQALPADLGLSWVTPEHRVIVGVGPLTRAKGFYDAIYSLDMLHFLHPTLQLVLVGSGPDEPRIRFLAQGARVADRVHFLGEVPDITPLLRRADLCWVPSHENTGRYAMLQAMAAGKAVVAGDVPLLRECASHGESALFAAASDKMAFARETRRLLDDPDLAARIGEAAYRRVREQHSLDAFVNLCEEVYRAPGAAAS